MKRGFSLVQVLVAAGLLGVLALGFSQLLSGAMKGQKHVQNAVDFDILKTALNQVFSTKACNGALYTGATNTIFVFPPGMAPDDDLANPTSFPDGIPVDEVKHGASRVAKRDDTLSGGLKITSLALTSAIYDGDQSVDGVNYKAFAARFQIKATKLGSSIGSTELEHTLSVRLLANAADGKVEKCGNAEASGPPAGMVDAGAFYIDGADRGPLASGGSMRPALVAHKTCNTAGFRLCRASEIHLTCESNLVVVPSQGMCIEAGTSNQAYVGQGDCSSLNLNSQLGCGGAVYRCCRDK